MASGGNTNGVKEIKADSEFQREITLAKKRLVVVDFFATWYETLV